MTISIARITFSDCAAVILSVAFSGDLQATLGRLIPCHCSIREPRFTRVAHHGSSTSSQYNFKKAAWSVSAANPADYRAISAPSWHWISQARCIYMYATHLGLHPSARLNKPFPGLGELSIPTVEPASSPALWLYQALWVDWVSCHVHRRSPKPMHCNNWY